MLRKDKCDTIPLSLSLSLFLEKQHYYLLNDLSGSLKIFKVAFARCCREPVAG